jgi:aryl-alcohol dehydrogenase-like predicted oxidoreductase
MEKRRIGRLGIEVSAMGLGCWAIGGQFYFEGKPDGYGQVDDEESIRAIQQALDLGINFFDTSDAYGVGHSEKLIGRALAGRRDQAVIATKFGYFGSQDTKTLHGVNLSPDYIERACDASLKRLNTDYIDLYLLHVWEVSISELNSIGDTLDRLVAKGKIRSYGWSTDLLGGAELFSQRKNCVAIEQQLNVFEGSLDLVKLCEERNLASLNRSPLAMGMLSGKFSADSVLPKDDVRGAGFPWYESLFKNGRPTQEALRKLDSIREILTSNGRTPAQGALAWIWAKSNVTIPIPGFKNVKQVQENAKALEFGPLTQAQVSEIEKILRRDA